MGEAVKAKSMGLSGFPLEVELNAEPFDPVRFIVSGPLGVSAIRDALAPHDERVQGPGFWRVDRNGHGEVALWRFRHADDQIPSQHALRPHLADRQAPAWIVWRAALAGLGLADVE